jgi:tRNA (uracil-5-)-methyltransferase TRM9
MNRTTISRLIDLNQQFYLSFAEPFSATRQRLQPGVIRILEQISPQDDLLDLGCGNGELARELSRCGHQGVYTGVDFSPTFLDEARQGQPANFRFILADLSIPGWNASLASSHFNAVMAYAVLHHLPGWELRIELLRKMKPLLKPDGRFIHSEWQFLNSPRLSARLQPWESIGLSAQEVDPGDYLLDWRHGGTGLRYVHHFSEAELADLAAQAGFEVVESFYSDGETRNLGLYQVWKIA